MGDKISSEEHSIMLSEGNHPEKVQEFLAKATEWRKNYHYMEYPSDVEMVFSNFTKRGTPEIMSGDCHMECGIGPYTKQELQISVDRSEEK